MINYTIIEDNYFKFYYLFFEQLNCFYFVLIAKKKNILSKMILTY